MVVDHNIVQSELSVYLDLRQASHLRVMLNPVSNPAIK